MKKIIWLRISYWLAAIADFIIALLVLMPERMGVKNYVYPMGLISSAAFSWGIMLILADRKPIERKWVLIPTMIVVVLLGITSLQNLLIGNVSLNSSLPALISSAIVFTVLLISYIKNK